MYSSQILSRPLLVATIVFIACSAFLLLGSKSVREHVATSAELTGWAASSYGSHKESDVFNATLGVRRFYRTRLATLYDTCTIYTLISHPNLHV